jgi:5-dehydro-4-deoxyglucarate dehydratase
MPTFDALRLRITEGIMAFPATPFLPDGSLDRQRQGEHVALLAQHQPTALVAAGGAGEVFSLTLEEHEQVVRTTVQHANGVPVIGGAAYGTLMACEMARAVERTGGDAVLLLPPYLVRSEQEGLFRHIRAVCNAVSIAVIPYSRDNAVLTPDTMVRLADACPNIIALKDGTGDLAGVAELKKRAGDRLAIVNGAPTAEVLAPQFQQLGVQSYSSAIFTCPGWPAISSRRSAAAIRRSSRQCSMSSTHPSWNSGTANTATPSASSKPACESSVMRPAPCAPRCWISSPRRKRSWLTS